MNTCLYTDVGIYKQPKIYANIIDKDLDEDISILRFLGGTDIAVCLIRTGKKRSGWLILFLQIFVYKMPTFSIEHNVMLRLLCRYCLFDN